MFVDLSLRLILFCHFGERGSCVAVVILCDAMKVRGELRHCKFSVIDYNPHVHKARMPVVVSDSTLGYASLLAQNMDVYPFLVLFACFVVLYFVLPLD